MANLQPFLFAWAVLVVVVICLALYRRMITIHEDNFLHLDKGEASQASNQIAIWHKLDIVDRIGKALTAVAAVSGMALVALYIYEGWMMNR